MRIRSITFFCNPGFPLEERQLRAACRSLVRARAAYEGAGYDVQTVRLASVPFTELLGEEHIDSLPDLARHIEQVAHEEGVDYASLGPALPRMPASYSQIPAAIEATDRVFFSGLMTTEAGELSLEAAHACADVIVRTSTITADGFANLRFAALANVAPGAPFFPAAYHEGEEPAFALATEAADLAVEAFANAGSIGEGSAALVEAIEANGRRLAAVGDSVAAQTGARFGGIDFTLAPFPEESRSVGAAMEKLGVPRAGLYGSLAATAVLTDAIDRARFPRCGFSGVMLPVLEDAVLAGRAEDGVLTVEDLLLYSAVCGTGLDTVPLPGDVTPGQLVPLLVDLAALALRLDKPLTARLLPVPGRRAGDRTDFDFAYFANSRVMALEAEPLKGILGGQGAVRLSPRSR